MNRRITRHHFDAFFGRGKSVYLYLESIISGRFCDKNEVRRFVGGTFVSDYSVYIIFQRIRSVGVDVIAVPVEINVCRFAHRHFGFIHRNGHVCNLGIHHGKRRLFRNDSLAVGSNVFGIEQMFAHHGRLIRKTADGVCPYFFEIAFRRLYIPIEFNVSRATAVRSGDGLELNGFAIFYRIRRCGDKHLFDVEIPTELNRFGRCRGFAREHDLQHHGVSFAPCFGGKLDGCFR